VNENPVELSALGFDMLCLLIERTGEVVTTDDLAQLVWGHERAGEPSYIHTAVYRLRTALQHAGADNLIRNVRGVGYTLVGERRFNELVTEQPILEAALRSAQRAQMLVSVDLKVNLANSAAAALLGYEPTQVEALPAGMTFAPPEQSGDRVRMMEHVVASREPMHVDSYDLVKADGSEVTVAADISPVMVHGQVTGLLIELTP